MPKPKKVKFPKGSGALPANASITYHKQGADKRRAVITTNINGNTMRVTIEYDYPLVPNELIAMLDAQYADAIDRLDGDSVNTADEGIRFLNLASSLLSSGIAEGMSSYTEA